MHQGEKVDLIKLYDSACSDLCHNKIDGTFVGESNNLLETSLNVLKSGWSILVACDLQNHNDIFVTQKEFRFAKANEENIEQIKDQLDCMLYPEKLIEEEEEDFVTLNE